MLEKLRSAWIYFAVTQRIFKHKLKKLDRVYNEDISNPSASIYKCEKCKNEYLLRESDLELGIYTRGCSKFR